MSFFKRYPRLWITVWAVFGFGGLIIAWRAIFQHGVDVPLLARGLIGLAVAGTMISYLLPELRKTDATDQ